MKKMKRIALCLALLQLLLIFASCTGNEAITTGANLGNQTTASTTAPSTTGTPTTGTPTTETPTTEAPTTEVPTTEPPTTEAPTTETPTTETPTTEVPTTEITTTPPVEVFERLCLVDNGTPLYTIVNSTRQPQEITVLIHEFNNSFEKETGVTLPIILDTEAPTNSNELLFGGYRNRPMEKEIAESIPYAEYSIIVHGSRVLFAANTLSYYEKICKYFLRNLYEEDGCWYVDTDYVAYSENEYPDVSTPVYGTNEGYLQGGGVYFSMNNTIAATYENTNREEFDAYVASLIEEGYAKHADNQIGQMEFATYVRGTDAVQLQFNPAENRTTLSFFKDQFIPSTEKPTFEKVNRASINFQKRAQHINGWGLCFLIQLGDGSYVIIDGGKSSSTDLNNMLQFMRDNKPAHHTKPVVSLWILTHPHEDHVEMFVYNAALLSQQIQLDMIAYNFPITPCSEVDATGHYWADYYIGVEEKRAEYFPETTVWVAHTGQKLYLADAEIDVLYTHEDYYPQKVFSANDVNTSFRITVDGASVIVLGDNERGNAEMAAMYKEAFLAEVVQIAHHGNYGTTELYQAIDAKIVYWPTNRNAANDYMELDLHTPWLNTQWTRTEGDEIITGDRQHYTADDNATLYFDEL